MQLWFFSLLQRVYCDAPYIKSRQIYCFYVNINNLQKPIMYIGNTNKQLAKLGKFIVQLLKHGELSHNIEFVRVGLEE